MNFPVYFEAGEVKRIRRVWCWIAGHQWRHIDFRPDIAKAKAEGVELAIAPGLVEYKECERCGHHVSYA